MICQIQILDAALPLPTRLSLVEKITLANLPAYAYLASRERSILDPRPPHKPHYNPQQRQIMPSPPRYHQSRLPLAGY